MQYGGVAGRHLNGSLEAHLGPGKVLSNAAQRARSLHEAAELKAKLLRAIPVSV